MSPRRGFTLIEILVVIVIVAILAAILFPVFTAARNRAKMTSCQSRLYQYSRQGQMADFSQEDVSHCPYPVAGDDGEYVDVSSLYRVGGQDTEPDAGTVMAYCLQHLKRGGESTFKVPLEGKFTAVVFGHGTLLVDAKGVTRWQKQGKTWVQVPETGEVPSYPTIWHFPKDDFPPN